MKLLAMAFGLLLLTNGAHASNQPANKEYWLTFKAQSRDQRTQIANLGVSIEEVKGDQVSATGTEKNLAAAKASGMLLHAVDLSVKPQDFPQEDAKFHDFKRLNDELQQLAAQYPKLIKLGSIGKSLEGRDQTLLTFSTVANDQSKPAIFFMGGHHAREHISVETPLLLAKYLAEQYTKNDARIVKLLNSRTVYIVPTINPDGAEYDVASGEYQLWRKNRRDNGDGTFGVDLNRNYGYGWGGGGASPNTDDETFRGPKAFSEPETQNVKAFFDSHTNITIMLSFHTFSELILYPWGGSEDKIQDTKAYNVHKKMAEKMASWNGYTPEQASDLYVASGDTCDWAFGTHGVISFTFELDPKNMFNASRGFYPGQDQIQPIFQKNLEPALYLIDLADNPYRVLDQSGAAFGLNSPLLQ